MGISGSQNRGTISYKAISWGDFSYKHTVNAPLLKLQFASHLDVLWSRVRATVLDDACMMTTRGYNMSRTIMNSYIHISIYIHIHMIDHVVKYNSMTS